MARIDIKSNGATLNDGVLQLENGVAMDSTLRNVADQNNTTSPLLLSTTAVQVESPLRITTDDPSDMYLDCEDGSANNRFNITRNTASQQVNLNFASNPAGSTTTVGAIRTFTDGVNLGEVVTFREDGQVTFTERVNVEADSLVTTETCSVIAASTTNANLVIAPNGTGALIASIPDGTATGGNARGTNAIDLQSLRTLNTQVASGANSVAIGINNTSSGTSSVVLGGTNSASGSFSTIGGGTGNSVNNQWDVISGGRDNVANTGNGYASIGGGVSNLVTSTYGTVSGGQGNVASTNTHATVVGGQSNTSSGHYAVSGGFSNTASGYGSIAGGLSNTASGARSIALGWLNSSSNQNSIAMGYQNTANGDYSLVIGAVGTASGQFAVSLGYNSVSAGRSSVCIGGETNRANATNAIVMSGTQGLGYLYSQIVSSPNLFTAQGDCQNSQLNAFRTASLNSAATTVLSLDGTGTTNLIIPNGTNRMWNVQVRWVAVVTAITGTATGVTVGDTKASTDLLAVAKRSGTTTVSAHTSAGTHAIETIAGSLTAANIAYTAGASQEMAITFTGPTFIGGGSVTMRVVAAISLTEVAY